MAADDHIDDFDAELDRRLRAVPTPRRLLARLSSIAEDAAESPETLDARLVEVPIPAGLHARLSAVAEDSVPLGDSDDVLDARLRDVAIPFGLSVRLRRIAERRRIRWSRLAAVAALVLLAFSGQWSLILGHLQSLFVTGSPAPIAAGTDPLTLDLQTELVAAGDVRFSPPKPRPIVVPPATSDMLQFTLTQERALLDRKVSGMVVAHRPRPDVFQTTAWALGTSLNAGEVLGAPPRYEDLPDVAHPVVRVARGVDVPLGADEAQFLLEYGVFPRVSPREFPKSVVPLTHDTSAYETARAALAAGEWPPVEQMRAEEFLAAVNFAYGRPTDRAARLIVAGAAAPWNPSAPPEKPLPPERTSRLLQLSVQARELPAAKRPPTHLTVAVDLTTSMQAGGRLQMTKQALRSLVERLGGGDRLTLVALRDDNPILVEDGGRAELDQLLAAVEWLSPGGSGTLSRGVLAACMAAARREPARNVERRVVVISDAFGEFDPTGLRVVDRFLQTSAARSLRLDLIDVSRENEETPWSELVGRRDGKLFRVESPERIRSALMEALTGRNQVVAAEAVLSIEFNPTVVTSYRLIGHEPTPLAGLMPRRTEVDLHAGQAATMLYELQLAAGKDQDVATVVLKWRDPTDGTPQEAVQKVTRGTLNPAFEKASPTLQLATIAASAAARLGRSPWGDNVAPAEVLQWARRLQRLGTVRGVEPWIELLEQVQKLPPPRRVDLRGAR